jgi:hypothetical protein
LFVFQGISRVKHFPGSYFTSVISNLFLLTICKKGVQKYNIIRAYPIFFHSIEIPSGTGGKEEIQGSGGQKIFGHFLSLNAWKEELFVNLK